MKNHPYLKSFYWSILVGVAGIAAAANVQAADIGMAVLADSQVQSSAKSPTPILRSKAASAKGAEGPIRTETFSDQKPKVDSEMLRRDLQSERYPMTNNAGIP